ncbi:hypothetical protein GCM10009798_17960 [Nocardioides panacihumi]|uniref:Big-1 domain-containing protein n=1 Tax=Nocardioides panacihumi TaxID=400774 RepID=A0ABP5CBZ6_9ACTN
MFRSLTVIRRGSLLIVTLLLVAMPLVAVPTVVTASAAHSAGRWAGYEIPRTGRAAGGWIGGYRIGATPIFLVTPSREPNRRGYQRARLVDDLSGRSGATRGETARAAWILSKYGGYRDATQAAAVDASVYALLVGGRWSTSGARGARRINETPDWLTVRRFARIMLNESRRHAGPYRVRVTATGTDVGGTIEATVTVTDGHGRPAAGLPLTIAATGAASSRAVTGDNGRAVARFAASKAGWHRITAIVREVPEHRLHLRLPLRRGQAAAAEGGDRRTLVASTLAPVRGPQALGLPTNPVTVAAGSPAQVAVTVTGDGTSRSAVGTLYGPAGSASLAQCAGQSVGTVRTTVRADGHYVLPGLTPRVAGYYVWHVAVAGTPTALPVAACGADTTVKAVAVLSMTARNPTTLKAPDNATVDVALSGWSGTPGVDVTLNVYGPYATEQALRLAGCKGTILDSPSHKMNGGTTLPFSTYIEQAGWYALQATTPSTELSFGAQSLCADAGTELHVS